MNATNPILTLPTRRTNTAYNYATLPPYNNAFSIDQVDQLRERLADAVSLGEMISGSKGAEDDVKLIREVKQRLTNLPIGGLLPCPGGWGDESGGHAIFYVWERTSADTFAYIICNTGTLVPTRSVPNTARTHTDRWMRVCVTMAVILQDKALATTLPMARTIPRRSSALA